MQSMKNRWQEDLFVASPLRDLVPDDHVLKRVDAVLDLSWLHDALRECYCQDNGRPSIDPESALRLMIAGFFDGIVHDRKLMRRAQTDIAFRWFAGYRLDEKLPDHSSLTRIRQRWGAERFKLIFEKTVAACLAAGLVEGRTIHVDATLIRADVSWESLTRQHAEQVVEENEPGPSTQDDAPNARLGRNPTKPKTVKRRSTTDPDATMAARNKGQRAEPSFKQHTAVDDRAGVVVDVALTTGDVHEGDRLLEQLEGIEQRTGVRIETATADKGYAHAANYGALEAQGIDAVIPPKATARPKRIPGSRFKYDAQHRRIRCPGGKRLLRKGYSTERGGWRYSASAHDCSACPLRDRCFSPTQKNRTILLRDGHEALLRARRRKARGWDDATKEHYKRHRWRVEGAHGEAKTQHGLRRAARHGIDNVTIQVYLIACVMNLKRLAKTAGELPAPLEACITTLLRAATQFATQIQARRTTIISQFTIT